MAPADVADRTVGAALVTEHTHLTMLGDIGHNSAPLATELVASRI
ncbi:MAG TPA: hypothetical protein VGW38_24730 [Chloroflexota bacterium]|nr:hypothetical protein [Chloroflexota bacterium]